jgi:hypothetical protein
MNLRLPLLCAALCALVAALPARAQNHEFLYDLRSAVVEYQVTTSGRGLDSSGTDTLWIADKGRRTARLQKHLTGRSKGSETENLSLLLDGWVYNLDLKKRTGVRMSMEQMQKMAAQATGQPLGKDYIERNGGRMLPPEEFLGRMCEVFEFKGFKTWAYKGVPLKTEGAMMGMKTSMVATRFEENATIPAGRFDIPKDIKIEDMPDMSALIGGMMSGRPPAEDNGDEEIAPRKPNKPAPRKPEVDEPAPDAPPPAKPKLFLKQPPKPQRTEGAAVRLSFEEFGAIVSKIHVPGYTTMAPESSDGAHMVNLLDTRGRALGVSVLPLSVAEGMESRAALKVDSRFEHQGHAAISGVLTDAVEGDSSIVLVRYPERKLALLVRSAPGATKEELLKLLEQIDL